MTSNHTNINVQTKSNTVNKITTTHSVCAKFILGYSFLSKGLKTKINVNTNNRVNKITTFNFKRLKIHTIL